MNVLITYNTTQYSIELLEQNGFTVNTTTVADNQLVNYINTNNISILLVKTTRINKAFIDACPTLKLIGYAGNQNIDVSYAKKKNIHVITAEEATRNAIAELVFAHVFGMVRFLHQANREMPLEGDSRFNELKKQFANGSELQGKTIGIIGLKNAAEDIARIAFGVGMNVIGTCNTTKSITSTLRFFNKQSVSFVIKAQPVHEVLTQSDIIVVNLPKQEKYCITEKELGMMKKGIGIVNVAHGSIIDEVALVNAIEAKHVKYAALDVFENQPNPEVQLLMNPEISLSPNLATTTIEATEKIGMTLAKQIIGLLK